MSTTMTVINEEANGTLGFGDFKSRDKLKADGFEHGGHIYNVKTYCAVTRLERDDALALESVPGCMVSNFVSDEKGLCFTAEGFADTHFTVGLEPSSTYELLVDGKPLGLAKTNIAGKTSFTADLTDDRRDVEIRYIP